MSDSLKNRVIFARCENQSIATKLNEMVQCLDLFKNHWFKKNARTANDRIIFLESRVMNNLKEMFFRLYPSKEDIKVETNYSFQVKVSDFNCRLIDGKGETI